MLMRNEHGFMFDVQEDYFARYAWLSPEPMTEEEAIRFHLNNGWSYVTLEELLPPGYLDRLVERRASLKKRDFVRLIRETLRAFGMESLVPMERRLTEVIGNVGRGSDGNQLDRLPQKDWYTAEEVAKEADRSLFQVRKWCREGRILAKKTPGGEWRVAYGELVRYKHEGLRSHSA